MTLFTDRLKSFIAAIPGHLRHPTRRGLAWAVAAVPLLLLLYTLVLIPFTPSISDLRKAKTAKPSVIMSADGKELAMFKRANRDWVKLANISPNVVNALIATEDHRFYEHHGMDLKRTVSAVFHTVTGDMQGGSTLTQQLARNLYPEEIGRAPTLTRKLKEAITSLKIEAVYTKDEILETYLNTVPFLYNAYGIEMAARTYFDKSADELDVLESATLVGMLKGTSYYNPVINPERAEQRRNIVLAQMVRHDKLDAATLDKLKKKPLKIDFERQTEELGSTPHLAQQLRRWLVDWADRHNYNIYADGLVVHTTLDSRLQDMANAAVTRQADRLQTVANGDWRLSSGWNPKTKTGPARELVLGFVRDSKEYKAARAGGQSEAEALQTLLADQRFMQALRADKMRLQAGFLALNPANGHVMAWVGSRDFAQDQFDHVQQARRQPGSTFKPFVYGAAFENGAKPSDTFMDEALEIPLGNGAFWRPGDAGGPSNLPMTLRQGLMYSRNTITAQVMQQVGPARVASLARAMGVRQSKLDEVLSLALGTSPVTLKEMVSGYSTIVNDGRYIEPIMVTRVEDRNGRVLETFADKTPETAMQTTASQTLLDAMRGVIDQGTGAGIRSQFGIRGDVAGKTGTTQDNTDGWFILMHPQLVAGAWVGFNDNRVTMSDRWGQGARSALPIVGDFFQHALRAKVIDAKAEFSAPRDTSANEPAVDPNGLPPGTEPQESMPSGGGPTMVPEGGTMVMSAPSPSSSTSALPSSVGVVGSGAQPPAANPGNGAPAVRYITIPAPPTAPMQSGPTPQPGYVVITPEPSSGALPRRVDGPPDAAGPAPNFPQSEVPAPAR